jgi:uncharacterized protein
MNFENMKPILRILCLVSFLLFGFAGHALADQVSDAKQRIAARQSEVASLKLNGAIGENNQGYLEVRGGGGNAPAVASAENSDRGVLYAEVAKLTGKSPAEVGKARAKEIAANSAPGVWIQREDGSWQKK